MVLTNKSDEMVTIPVCPSLFNMGITLSKFVFGVNAYVLFYVCVWSIRKEFTYEKNS